MKAIILIFFLYHTGARAACLSGSLTVPAQLDFDLKLMEDAVQDFETTVKEDLPSDLSLIITLEALNPRVNAEINKKNNEVLIQVMGGMLMHPQMSDETFKLLLCHELGHLLGGPPLKSRNGWSSTEGQADYYSSLECVRKLNFDEKTFIESALALTRIYAEVTRERLPRLDTCDERKVERTNYGYPPVQCRLDTLLAGWQGKARPNCWFRE